MCNRNNLKPGRYHRRRGASAAEMAIILPVFVTIVLGGVDFGRFAYNYIAVSNAARAGAAWAMLNQPASYTSPPAAWQTSIYTAESAEMSSNPGFQLSSATFNGATNGTANPVTPVLNADGTTYRFTTTVSYQFQTVVTWNVSVFGTTLGIPNILTLSSSVTMRFIRP